MLVLVESRKNPAVITTTPVTRQKPLFLVESLRSITMQARVITATISAVMITDGLRILLIPPLSGIS